MLKANTRILGVVLLLLGSVMTAAATESGAPRLLRVEQELLGSAASRTWQNAGSRDLWTFDQVGGDGLDEPRRDDEVGGSGQADDAGEGSSNLGRKFAAGGLSALVPGMGQLYNGDKKKGFIMFGVEVAIWTAWLVFDDQADDLQQDAKNWAYIYAGAGGTDDDYYWRAVGRYASSDDFNEDLLRQRRATDDPLPPPVGPATDWLWVNDTRQDGYRELYDDADDAYTRRDYMILFAVINRVVSVVDAVVGAGDKPGTLETEVMGMNLGVEVSPIWNNPGARATISRSF